MDHFIYWKNILQCIERRMAEEALRITHEMRHAAKIVTHLSFFFSFCTLLYKTKTEKVVYIFVACTSYQVLSLLTSHYSLFELNEWAYLCIVHNRAYYNLIL